MHQIDYFTLLPKEEGPCVKHEPDDSFEIEQEAVDPQSVAESATSLNDTDEEGAKRNVILLLEFELHVEIMEYGELRKSVFCDIQDIYGSKYE